MKKTYLLLTLIATISVALLTSCETHEIQGEVNRVSQFVYDGMSAYYYWADDMVNKKPELTDADPTNYFNRVLHPLTPRMDYPG